MAKKLIMNLDDKFDDMLNKIEDSIGIKRSAIIRLAVNEKFKQVVTK